eukprot:1750686-Pyramimonas_sp.AAC.2
MSSYSSDLRVTYELIYESLMIDPGRGRPVLPAAQRGASCPVDHPCRGPLLFSIVFADLGCHGVVVVTRRP